MSDENEGAQTSASCSDVWWAHGYNVFDENRLLVPGTEIVERVRALQDALSCYVSCCLDHGQETDDGDFDVLVPRHLVVEARNLLGAGDDPTLEDDDAPTVDERLAELRSAVRRYLDRPGCNNTSRRTQLERLAWALRRAEEAP